MIPWCFAYDKFNYAKYLMAYYAQMANRRNILMYIGILWKVIFL